MRVIAYEDANEFAREVMPWIEREPVRYNLIATVVALLASGDRPSKDDLVLWTVVDGDGSIAGLAIQTPPWPMLITDMPPAALQTLAAEAKAQGLQRFNGPNARCLAELVAGDAPIRMSRASGLHWLRRVVPPEDVPGHARLAELADVPLAFEWAEGFQADVGGEEPLQMSQMETLIAGQGLWVWEHEHRLVSMASWTKPVHGVVRINLVYTPPELRGHGYASALVSAVSQTILDRGHIPILYTDLANPTSNKIYAAVGFEKLEEPQLWELFYTVPTTAVEAVNNLAVRWASSAGAHGTTVLSAASVWPLLALLADAATGPARDELLSAVGPVDDPRAVALELIGALDGIAQVRAALGVWVRDGIPLTPAWADAAVLTGQAALDEWASRRTGGLIGHMPVSIDRDTLLVLAGALAVRTPWRRPFEAGVRGVLFRTGDDFDTVSVLHTPYGPLTRVCVEGTGDIDVHLLMGEPGSIVAEGIRTLGQAGTLGSRVLADGGTGPGITLTEMRSFDPSPELLLITQAFTIDAGHDLLTGGNAVLFGLSAVTDTSRGHFPGISPFPLAISAARQDATAAFSANGFEAAAVTAMTGVAGGVPPHTKQILRVEFQPPFGFLAVHRPSGLVLTAGMIASSE